MCSKKALVSTIWCHWAPLGTPGWVLTRVAPRHRWVLLDLTPLGAAGHICANFATCSWEPLTMLNPHFVAGEHGLFGDHKSKDIWTFLQQC